MRNSNVLALILGWLPIVCPHAAELNLSGINVGELGQVQSETILYKAKAERAKAKHEADNSDIKTQPQPASTMMPALSMPQHPPYASTEMKPLLPVVKEISGSGTRLSATLLFSNGSVIDATSGKELPEGYRVQQVTLDGVVLSKNGKRFPLTFSNQVSRSSSTAALPGLNPGL